MQDNTNSDDAKRSCFLPRTRCTAAERRAIEAKAKAAGLSLSEYQRRALLGSTVKVRTSTVDVQAMKLLQRMSANLNQLVKSAHIHHAVDSEYLHDMQRSLETMAMEIVDGS